MTNEQLYDVVAVGLPPNQPIVRLLATRKTLKNAEAIVGRAYYRYSIDNEFFAVVPAGKYKKGDIW